MLRRFSLPYQSDASRYFDALRDLPWAAWLDSGARGRYDILVARPLCTLLTEGAQTTISDVAGVRQSEHNPFNIIRKQLGAIQEAIPEVPFAGGALGYWGYDLSRRYQSQLSMEVSQHTLPQMAVGIYDWAVVLDHQQQSASLVSRLQYAETEKVLPEILERLHRACDLAPLQVAEFFVQQEVSSNLTSSAYQHAFESVQRYLHAGDCYQVNLAQCYSAAAEGDAFSAYLALREKSPAPYSAFLNWPCAQILSASPERFLQVKAGEVETKPIKGTRRRGGDDKEDAALRAELSKHPKDRAENLMIVDLLRNDLSKSCEPGSVKTPRLFEVETFSNVHHLVSTVVGKLQQGKDALHLLQDCFPGGSITGAPKLRAMEIIEELEPDHRGIYCGAIGYVGHDGNMDTNIAIRTMVYSNNTIRCWVGGGIVADSQCDAEYQETLDKAAAMLAVLQKFRKKNEGKT